MVDQCAQCRPDAWLAKRDRMETRGQALDILPRGDQPVADLLQLVGNRLVSGRAGFSKTAVEECSDSRKRRADSMTNERL
jgi:hypothetical protein